MARLIRTEKEVEGRFEEVWIVVEEDPLEQWPEGPLEVVGRPAPRKDGHERVRGEARYTADLKLPGMLHAAVLRSPHAHARVKRIDLAPALALPGVRAAIGPGEAHGLEEEAGFSGRGRRGRRGRHVRPGARRGRGDRRRVGGARGRARSRRRRQARAVHGRAAHLRARRRREGARPGGRRRRGDVPHADRPPQLDGDAPGGLRVAGRHAPRLHLDAVHLGRPPGGRRHARPARGQGARRLRVHGRRLRLEERPRRVHVRRRRAREADGAAGALRAHAARGAHLRGQPQRDDPAAARPAPAATGRSSRFDGEFTNSVGWSGWNAVDRGADADALRLRERPHGHATARSSTRRR